MPDKREVRGRPIVEPRSIPVSQDKSGLANGQSITKNAFGFFGPNAAVLRCRSENDRPSAAALAKSMAQENVGGELLTSRHHKQ